MNKETTAQELMKTNVLCLKPDMSLREAANFLTQHQISGAPVVDQNQNLIGVVSQADILKKSGEIDLKEVVKDGYFLGIPAMSSLELAPTSELDRYTVKDAMNPYVICVSPHDSASNLAKNMLTHKFHRLIVAQDRKVLGIITSFDLLKLLVNE